MSSISSLPLRETLAGAFGERASWRTEAEIRLDERRRVIEEMIERTRLEQKGSDAMLEDAEKRDQNSHLTSHCMGYSKCVAKRLTWLEDTLVGVKAQMRS